MTPYRQSVAPAAVMGDDEWFYVDQYVESTYVRIIGWPCPPAYSKDELEVLAIAIERELGTSVNRQRLSWLVRRAVEKRTLRRFSRHFTNLCPSLSRASSTVEYARGYLEQFGHDDRYLEELARLVMARRAGIESVDDLVDWLIWPERRAQLASLRARLSERLAEAEQHDRRERAIAEAKRRMSGISAPAACFATIEVADELDGTAFERFVAALLRRMGFRVEHIGGPGDQGADVLAERHGERVAVQAKRYASDASLDNSAVQQVIAARGVHRCSRAIVVTTARFGRGAREAALANQVELWDRDKLVEWLRIHPVPLTEACPSLEQLEAPC